MLKRFPYLVLLSLLTPLFFGSCVGPSRDIDANKRRKKAPWVKALQSEVAALGANNWIVVTESAYPTPNHTGLRVIVADAKLPEVIAEVMDAIESEGHIWPKIYTVREFDHITEDYAPGVEKLKASREAAFSARKKRVSGVGAAGRSGRPGDERRDDHDRRLSHTAATVPEEEYRARRARRDAREGLWNLAKLLLG